MAKTANAHISLPRAVSQVKREYDANEMLRADNDNKVCSAAGTPKLLRQFL